MSRRIAIGLALFLAAATVNSIAQQVPAPTRRGNLPQGARCLFDLAYAAPGHPQQTLDLFIPRGSSSHPLVIAIHGGAFMMGSKDDEDPMPWLNAGFAVASINYRLSQDAFFPAQIEDCKAAVRWLRKNASTYHLDSEKFAAYGTSAGGYLAAMLGVTGQTRKFDVGKNLDVPSTVQAVVDFYGPTDFLQMDAHRLPNGQRHDDADSPESRLLGGALQENAAKVAMANPINYITRKSPPFFIAHGDQDPIVPHHQSELLCSALIAAGVPAQLYTVSGAGHAFQDNAANELKIKFLVRALKVEQPLVTRPQVGTGILKRSPVADTSLAKRPQ